MKKPVLLVVDDQKGVRHLLYETFTLEGYEVKMAENGMVALEMISKQLPDLVLLDLKMPFLGGIETLKEIRKNHSGLEVIMMTACGETDMLEETKNLGVKHYLVKPFDIIEIRKLVKSVLSESREKGIISI